MAISGCYSGALPLDSRGEADTDDERPTHGASTGSSDDDGPDTTTTGSEPEPTTDAEVDTSTGGDDPQGDQSTGTGGDSDSGSDTEGDTDPGTSTGEMIDCEMEVPTSYDDGTALSWVSRVTGTSSQRMSDLLVLDDGRVLATGQSDSHDVILADGLPGALSWSDPEDDPFFLAALQPTTGALDWAYIMPNDGWLATTELVMRSDGTIWMGGRVDAFDQVTFTWPDGSTETIDQEIGFVMRIDQGGQLQELFTYEAESVGTLGVAPDDSLVAGGVYWSTEVFGPGEPNETQLSANGGAIDEAYVAKWQVDGDLAWAISLTDGNGEDAVIALDVDDGGDIYVTGRYGAPTGGSSKPAIFGEGPAAQLVEPYGEGDGFVARLDGDGNLQWVRRFGGPDEGDAGTLLRVLGDGSVAVAGGFQSDEALFGEGEAGETTLLESRFSSAFLARFSPSGDLLWARSLGGGSYYGPSDMELTPDGDIAVIVDTEHGDTTAVQVDGQCTHSLPLDGEMHVLVYDIDGNLQWTRHDPWDGGIFDSSSAGIAFDGSTGYMSGSFHDATFGEGEPGQAYYETQQRDAAVSAFTF